jgi:hypothetical protein
VPESFLDEVRREFRSLRKQAEKALAQVDDGAFFAEQSADANSMAVVVKHVGGNLRSRWREFLTTDGEKPDRDRDREFVILPDDTRDLLMRRWAEGWSILEGTLERLTPDDLSATVQIRSEPHTVVKATLRSLTHTAGHVGQIVMAAKEAAGERWQTLSIPRGESESFNEKLRERFGRG